ncbi:TetR family transcriptional regulator [Croceicoccus ponticola]|uniref:TetR family transcriptional regulator n=1 Tax=Croceicoccus ponticola TaxID=2217664 RepID=A0A437GWQ0_9SPHN|nr:TetR/AcrR family transcriptional regulator [Croceicoccus ponticola]RVQ66540.1 TetR family transcriptional regulator [Croceicoccus ponticola]
MPLIVDREERRGQVASLAFDLVADMGIEAVTFRQVAGAAGTSTAIVSNWFDNKGDLLFEVYRIANRRVMDRLEAAFAQDQALIDCLSVVLPVTEENLRTWRVWLAFWGRAHIEASYREETARNARSSLDLYCRMLARRYGRKEGAHDPLVEALARRLIATVGGIALQGVLAPDDWSLESLRDLIATEIRVLDKEV